VLTRILDDAVRDRMLPSNPSRGVRLPAKAPRRHVYLTAQQLGILANEVGRYKSLVLLLGVGGLRWGEAAALRVGDIDFLRRRVELHRNAVMVSDRVVVGTLKSHKNRAVALPAFVIDALAITAAGKGRDELLWATAAGTPLGSPGSLDVVAGLRGDPLPAGGPNVPADHRPRPAAYGGIASHPRRG
jgi:integrase